ncbi:MAG: hypothetical protein ACI8V5_002709, partial [Limisphaerales bacterium]
TNGACSLQIRKFLFKIVFTDSQLEFHYRDCRLQGSHQYAR